jgi:hypothetical protein
MSTLSFSSSARGTPDDFFTSGIFFRFFALGGVFEKPETLSGSSSLSTISRFFGAGFVLRVVCVIFFGAARLAAGFFAGATFVFFYIPLTVSAMKTTVLRQRGT